MFARANINVESSHSVTLPVAAVLIKDGHNEVVLLETEPNHFVEREVTTGQTVGGRVPVLRGLNPGDHVVTKGALLIDSNGEQLL
jgi:cobalt-zinc-cadmium efflux system membrane fusion protein